MRGGWWLWAIVAAGATVHAADWPQWRGSERNGAAATSPPLAASWPPAGPRKVWQSEKIASGGEGGLGSPVVAGGRVFVLASSRYSVPIEERKLSDQGLRQLGWAPEKLPEYLLGAVEQARQSDERAALKQNEVAPWVDKWLKANLDGEQAKKFGNIVRDRLQRGRAAFELEMLGKLTTIKDKAFANQQAIDQWFAENGIEGDLRKKVMAVIPTTKTLGKDHVWCLSAADGATLWRKDYPGQVRDYGASSTPCVAGERLYALFSDGAARCFDVTEGTEIWQAKCPRADGNSSFLVLDNLAVVLSGGVVALNVADGTVAWTQPKVSAPQNSPVVWRHEGKAYLLCNTEGNVFCLDASDGKVLWSAPGGLYSTAVIAADGMVIMSGHGNVGLSCYGLSPEKVERLWSINGQPPRPSTRPGSAPATTTPVAKPLALADRGANPLIHDGYVYAVGGGWAACVQLATGRVAWHASVPIQEIASPILADGKVFAQGTEGRWLLMLRAAPERMELLGKAQIATAVCSSPAFADGRLYLRLTNAVGCYDLTEAGNVQTLPASAPATGQPAR